MPLTRVPVGTNNDTSNCTPMHAKQTNEERPYRPVTTAACCEKSKCISRTVAIWSASVKEFNIKNGLQRTTRYAHCRQAVDPMRVRVVEP